MRKLIIGSLVAVTLAGFSIPAAASPHVDFSLTIAPPAPRHEVVPAPRRGYVWVPGYWDWRAHRHHWVKGSWLRHRPGYHYEPARWVHRDGRYYYRRAGWRDADRDGVPNRQDRAPHNPRWR